MTTPAFDITTDTTAIVEVYEFISGTSSVPIPVSTAEYLGTLVKVDETTFALIDGPLVATLAYCYHAGELMDGRAHVDGWAITSCGRTWVRWAITY